MTKEAVDIITAMNSQWKENGFFKDYSTQDLQDALEYLEEKDKLQNESKRRAIWYEIEHRNGANAPVWDVDEYKRGPWGNAPRKRLEWDRICMSIYRQIEFLPPIPLVPR